MNYTDLEELLRKYQLGHHQCAASQKAEDKRAVARAIVEYVDGHGGVSVNDVCDTIETFLSRERDRHVLVTGTRSYGGRVFLDYCVLERNHFLKRECIRQTRLPDAIRLVQKLERGHDIMIHANPTETAHIQRRRKAGKLKGQAKILYKTEEGLQTYIANHTRPERVVRHYVFSEKGFLPGKYIPLVCKSL